MAAFFEETVTHVHHWTDRLFSFRTTRDPGFRFENGQFAMIGLVVDGKPLLRAYSLASPNHDEELEFFSIKVPDGPLTSRLQGIVPGDTVLIGRKATGTLVQDSLLDGRNLYLVSTGTGFAPFASIIRDFAIYERYEKVIAIHGCRQVSELGYSQHVVSRVRDDEYLSEVAAGGSSITPPSRARPSAQGPGDGRPRRREHSGKGRTGPPGSAVDRVMICGSEAMLKDMVVMMKQRGFAEGSSSSAGHYVIEKAFVEK